MTLHVFSASQLYEMSDKIRVCLLFPGALFMSRVGEAILQDLAPVAYSLRVMCAPDNGPDLTGVEVNGSH